MALAAAWTMSVTAVANLVAVLRYGKIRYAFGGWAPPIGIEWVADGLASVVMVAISLIASICLIYSGRVVSASGGQSSRALLHVDSALTRRLDGNRLRG